MDIGEIMKKCSTESMRLQTWVLGISYLGILGGVSVEGDQATFLRLNTERYVKGSDGNFCWEICEPSNLTVPTSTEFHEDAFGKISFRMGKLGLATLVPESIDPKQSLSKEI